MMSNRTRPIKSAGFLAAALLLLASALPAKLTQEQRQILIRDLTAEYATASILIPRSKKALGVSPDGIFDPDEWGDALLEFGPAAREGDMVQVTKVDFEDDKLLLELNHGIKGGQKWWHRIQISGGGSMGSGRQRQTTLGDAPYAPGGTLLAIEFAEDVPFKTAKEFQDILTPVLNFEARTATELYMEQLEPEVRKAIENQEVLVGMDREMVLLAKDRPDRKVRDFENGVETEDWIYGKPPGDIVFVTFENGQVIAVKHEHANLGGQVRKIEPIER